MLSPLADSKRGRQRRDDAAADFVRLWQECTRDHGGPSRTTWQYACLRELERASMPGHGIAPQAQRGTNVIRPRALPHAMTHKVERWEARMRAALAAVRAAWRRRCDGLSMLPGRNSPMWGSIARAWRRSHQCRCQPSAGLSLLRLQGGSLQGCRGRGSKPRPRTFIPDRL